MRIKRFLAPDMRTALSMVRNEQGPDAVILSNRVTPDGIEVVAATDYDEALVSQAMRASGPGPERIIAAPVLVSAPEGEAASFASIAAHLAGASSTSARRPALVAVPAATPAERADADAAQTRANTHEATPASDHAAARVGIAARARAVFRIGDAPPSHEPNVDTPAAADGIPSLPLTLVTEDHETDDAIVAPPLSRMEAMLAAMGAPPAPARIAPIALASAAAPAAAAAPSFAAAIAAATAATSEPDDGADDYHVTLSSAATPFVVPEEIVAALTATAIPGRLDAEAGTVAASEAQSSLVAPRGPPQMLQAAAAPAAVAPDPAMLAMREELASMRQLIERQMEQLSLERLRGSPARAAAYEALLSYGCDDALAQAVATRLDPRLPVSEIQEPMLAELATMLTIARSEPLDDGGVIALVGPTGAGKTTTAAKLAARFAARHRARDVALVTTDSERAGAHEQLHAHGRRLGITVCEAFGPEGLADALGQLADYPLVLVDTAGFAPHDRAVFGQILWLRAARKVRSLLVLPANAHPHHLGEVIRRYRPASPEGVVLTKLDETGSLGSALSVAVRHGLTLSYTTHGQQVPADIQPADATRLAGTLEKLRRAADIPLATEDRHVSA